jgi:ABC-2 type transport system ATP-binding protein
VVTDLPVVETHRLTKRFGSLTAVDDLDLTVRRGEVFGFLGPNGAGKTTTIRLLLDFLRPTSGSSRVLGGQGGDVDIRRRIGYLPAELPVDPRYTANELFAFYGNVRGGLDTARRDELVARFTLDPTRPAGHLSTGNRRKIGIVQAFVHRPELLILDEPTSGLDPLLQHEFHALVREAVVEGATVLLSSHVLPEVELLADRVGILRNGQLIVTAKPEELRRQARQRLHLTFADELPAEDVATFRAVDGVVEADAAGPTLHLLVEGSVDGVIKAAAEHTVLGVSTDDDDLEDAFLAFYGSDPDSDSSSEPAS